jgi:hypothetical protein
VAGTRGKGTGARKSFPQKDRRLYPKTILPKETKFCPKNSKKSEE